MAFGCESSSTPHFMPEYGFVELIDGEGNPIHEPGVTGEIVATSFHKLAIPLVRYRTNDLGQFSSEMCECGRNHKTLARLDGKTYYYLIRKDGERVFFRAGKGTVQGSV